MNHSDYSPNLLKFLPIIYIAWADAILNRDEIDEINRIIKKQNWLNEDEQVQLSKWLNPLIPPSPSEIKGWLLTIQTNAKKLPQDAKQSLIKLASNMVAVGANETEETLDKNLKALEEVELALGVIGREHFRMIPNIIEPIVIESENNAMESELPISELTKYLYGDQAKLIARVKSILQGPEFAYLKDPTIPEYRAKVLEWCQTLAQKNI